MADNFQSVNDQAPCPGLSRQVTGHSFEGNEMPRLSEFAANGQAGQVAAPCQHAPALSSPAQLLALMVRLVVMPQDGQV